MKRCLVFCIAVFTYLCYVQGQEALSAKNWINRGVQLYTSLRYADAQAAFEQAVTLEPQNVPAHLYLATACMIQWVPGVDSPDNLVNFKKAKTEFLRVLELDPDNQTALASLASLAYNSATVGSPQEKQAALEEARKWNVRRTQTSSTDREPFYYLGVISWSECYPNIQKQRIEAHLGPNDPGPLPDGRPKQQLREACTAKIEDGLYNLRHALELDPEQDDAMSYLNLMYRSKANLVSSPDEARSLVEEAERWANRSIETKRKKADTLQHEN
jgi:tetratricopeptide (TPR) repeat protein